MTNPLIADLETHLSKPERETIVVALPSRGEFYGEGVIEDDNFDAVEVHPVPALVRHIITDPAMVLSGHAVKKLMRAVAPQVLEPGSLVDMDAQVIMIASRILSNGPTFEHVSVCTNTSCASENKTLVDLNAYLFGFTPLSEQEVEEYSFEIEGIGQTVHTAPISYEGSVELIKDLVSREKVNADFLTKFDPLTATEEEQEQYASVISEMANTDRKLVKGAVIGVSTSDGELLNDRNLIDEWIDYLPESIVTKIVEKIVHLQKSYMDARASFKVTCSECGTEYDTNIEVDPIKFFTPAAEPQVTQSSAASSKSTKSKKPKSTKRLSK